MNYEKLKHCDAIRRTDSRGYVVVLPTAKAFAEMQRSKPTMPEEPGWAMAPRRAWVPKEKESAGGMWIVYVAILAAVAGVVWLI